MARLVCQASDRPETFDRLQELAEVEAELRQALVRWQDPFCMYLLGMVLCDR